MTIGKTRQAVVITNGVGPARGILRRQGPPGSFWHSRTAPPAQLAALIEHFWIVRWDLSGQPPFVQETLPHPNVHIVLEAGTARIVGPHLSRFVRVLEGRGTVFGIKFKAGGFHPFLGAPIAQLADSTVPLARVFGVAATVLQDTVLATDADGPMISAAVAWLTARWPQADAMVTHVSELVSSVVGDRGITSVDHLAMRAGASKRVLQRLFQQYVGASPKWVISRYRLHDAIEQLARREPDDWAAFALELGYFDQAHFIRDFKKLVGRTPAEFVRDERMPAGGQ